MFIDEAEIKVISGRGGDGVVHFRREKYVPYGGPDGGDGGRGGSVIIEVNPKLNTLFHFRQKSLYKATDGAAGGKQNMTGRSGEDLIIMVPPGTMIYDKNSNHLLGDLLDGGQQLLIARGGKGGRGNTHFANSIRQTPRIAEKGEPAEEKILRLELKLIADIGIIGVPNAGKSTLLARATNAKPKIAPYPFTTLEPNLGVAALDDDTILTLADVPGLIEGAHQGIGLGLDFLKHVQRTKVLIHLLDGQSEDIIADYTQIKSEIALFDPNLAKKPQIVAINKIDLPEVRERAVTFQAELAKRFGLKEIWLISALSGENVRSLLYNAAKLLNTLEPSESGVEEIPIYKMEKDPKEFSIVKTKEGWMVVGEAIERAAAMTYWDYPQSVRRFQKILTTLGVEQGLRAAGVQEGDTVCIGDFELEWSD